MENRQINYVFSCTEELKQLREMCAPLTNQDDYPYAKIIGLIVSTLGDGAFISHNNVINYVYKYLDDNDKFVTVQTKESIANKAMALYVIMYQELMAQSLMGFKSIFVITVDPYVLVGVIK